MSDDIKIVDGELPFSDHYNLQRAIVERLTGNLNRAAEKLARRYILHGASATQGPSPRPRR